MKITSSPHNVHTNGSENDTELTEPVYFEVYRNKETNERMLDLNVICIIHNG